MFGGKEVKYLERKISEKGVSPTEANVRGVKEAPAYENFSKSILGMLNHCGSFLKNIS